MNNKIAFAAVLVTSLLAACGKKEPDTSGIVIPKSHVNPNAVIAAANASLASSPASTSADAALPQANAATPLTQYKKMDDGGQQVALYYATSGEAVDYDKVATAASLEYRQTTDVFKRKSLLDQLKPGIDAQIADFKKNPYIVIRWDNGRLGHYDMAGQYFPVEYFPFAPGYRAWFGEASNFPYTVTNGEHFGKLSVTDQAKAQAIEASVASNSVVATSADAYLFVQSVDSQSHVIKLQLVQMTLRDSKGNEIGVVK